MRLNLPKAFQSGPMLGLAYLFLWIALWSTVQPYWMLPYGLRFGALLLTPMRYWGWVLGAEFAGTLGLHLFGHEPSGWPDFSIEELPEALVVAMSLWLLRHFSLHASLRNPQQVTRLLLSVILVVFATAATDALLMTVTQGQASRHLMIQVLGKELLSHYLAILLIVPLMIMLLRTRFDHRTISGLSMDGLLVMLPSMMVLLVLSRQPPPEPQFARVLSLAPVLFFAFRHGWRGASLAMIISSLGITLVDSHLGRPPSGAAAYLFLAVAGTGALMLGSATDALRRSSNRVAEQNFRLEVVNQQLDQLAQQMRSAARGNLQADENQRRHLATELHDELGQNITAIQTHVKLAQARLNQLGLDDISTSINAILAHMRRALHRLMDDLRPALLDEFGLMRALDEGPIRDLFKAAGIDYHTSLHGDMRLLDDDTSTAIYRLAQESATNAVKHSRASEFRLRLRIGERGGTVLALLDLRDNGQGLPRLIPREGRGLQGMRDRVISLGGRFQLRTENPGVRLRVLLQRRKNSSDINHTD